MTRLLVALIIGFGAFFFAAQPALATPSQFGDTGLLSQPVAQTLNEGNICIGLWTDCSKSGPDGDAVVVPVALTMGLGTFMEVYGSYPNLLFNGDEDASGRGYANAGFKFRIYGKRSDPLRFALDINARRSVSDNVKLDGLNDYGTRLIVSYKKEKFGIHGNVGYLVNDSPAMEDYDDQLLAGGGVEYFLTNRLRAIAEMSYATEKIKRRDGPAEATIGLQYFVTPHLTMNLGASVGVTDGSPDWRALFGLSTCQGVGSFNRPVPKLISTSAEIEEPEAEPVKLSKIKTLTPLIPRIGTVQSPVSHLEVPVNEPREEVVVDPADRLKMPDVSKLDAPAVAPIGASSRPIPAVPIESKVYRKFRFPEVTFDFDQVKLSGEGMESLSLVAEELRKEDRYFIISVEGHTDNVGSDSYNQRLSFKRAVTAATHLVLKHGMDPARLFVKGYGESRPLESNETDAGRARNRRVELLVLVPKSGSSDIGIPASKVIPDAAEAVAPPAAVVTPVVEQDVLPAAEVAEPDRGQGDAPEPVQPMSAPDAATPAATAPTAAPQTESSPPPPRKKSPIKLLSR